MKFLVFFLLIVGAVYMLPAQISQNMALWAQWHDDQLPSSGGLIYNDLWGYADGIGNEYAILGSLKQVHFIDVSIPSNPIEVASLTPVPGGSSIWRDFKTYDTYAYGVADQGAEGLLVMDLSNLPASVTLTKQMTAQFTRAHNIFIDVPNGRLYVAGSNTRYHGLWVYDIATDPANPSVLGSPTLFNFAGPSNSYVHDLYVEDNIAYCSHGFSGIYSYNFLNPATPYALQGIPTGAYNHSSWMIPGGQYLVYAQEVPKGMPLVIIDLLDSMSPVATFKEPLLAPDHMDNTPHNPFVKGNLIYTSYYEDGVQVFDISNINNPVRVAYYDTEPDNTTYSGTDNNWGVYPYLPSGNIIASDTEFGLFILQLQTGALPVDWLTFDALKGREGITLNWATASEKNNEGFDIERSTDGQVFKSIGKLDGNGTVYKTNNYDFIDTNPLEGTNYYRIKQKDFDGNSAYSKIVTAQWQSCIDINGGISITDNTTFILPASLRHESGTACLLSIEGRRIAEHNWKAGDEMLFTTMQLKPALYFLQYQSTCGIQVQKVLITK